MVISGARPNHVQCMIRCSIVVSISACHAEDPGSIPGGGVFAKFKQNTCCPRGSGNPNPAQRAMTHCHNPFFTFAERSLACKFPPAMTSLTFCPSEQSSQKHGQPTADKVGVNVSSAIVWLVRILGSHPSDPGSSPGGGTFEFFMVGKFKDACK